MILVNQSDISSRLVFTFVPDRGSTELLPRTANVRPTAGGPRRSGTTSNQLTVNLLVIGALNIVAGLVLWFYGRQPQYAYPLCVAGAVAFAVLLGLSRR